MWNSHPRLRTAFYLIVPLSIGLLLVAALIRVFSLSSAEIAADLRRIRLPYVALVFLCTFLHFWITARKWRMVTAQLIPIDHLRRHFFPYTALNALVSQFIPPQLSVTVVRSAAMRVHEDFPLVKGLKSTVFDQVFDFLVPAALIVPALLVALNVITFPVAVAVSVLALPLLGIAGRRLAAGLKSGLTGRFSGSPWPVRAVGRLLVRNPAQHSGRLLERDFVLRLWGMSILRYAVLLLRVFCIVLATGYDIPLSTMFLAVPFIILSFLIAVTPAGLGIREWGWVGVLVLFHVPTATASRYAIMNRLIVLVSILLINVVVLIWMLIGRRFSSRRAQIETPG